MKGGRCWHTSVIWAQSQCKPPANSNLWFWLEDLFQYSFNNPKHYQQITGIKNCWQHDNLIYTLSMVGILNSEKKHIKFVLCVCFSSCSFPLVVHVFCFSCLCLWLMFVPFPYVADWTVGFFSVVFPNIHVSRAKKGGDFCTTHSNTLLTSNSLSLVSDILVFPLLFWLLIIGHHNNENQ